MTVTVTDASTERPVACRVGVLCSDGTSAHPDDALRKRGTGRSQFYADGTFVIDVPSGPTEILVERGTEYRPWRRTLYLREGDHASVAAQLDRWFDRRDLGWVAANPHVHYDDETRLIERIRMDPRVEDLDVMATSHVERRGAHYTGNDLPIGLHPESTTDHIIDTGEECRHNKDVFTAGFGHVMLIGISAPILPISRGLLVGDEAPDYPPLIGVCEQARKQGGLIYWCHGAVGFEAPVAALRGLADGVGLLDPWWLEPEFDTWYRLLNCGFRLAALTGGDWYICSSHRTYVECDRTAGYPAWLQGVKDGRTLATSGPILELTVEGMGPATAPLEMGNAVQRADAAITWRWIEPIDVMELIVDGAVVHRIHPDSGEFEGHRVITVDVGGAGWVAARCFSPVRSPWDHHTWAHTSPIYLRDDFDRRAGARGDTADRFEEAVHWLETEGTFDADAQRSEILSLYRDAQRELRGS